MMTLVRAFLTQFTYLALILVLMLAGTGMPIPEDVPLIFSGYLCNQDESPIPLVDTDRDGIPDTKRVPNTYLMILAGMIGVLAGDTIVFNIGRHGIESNNFVTRHLRKVMHSKRREKVERHFAKHGNLTIFVARFMPGFRSIVFAFAGLSKMSYARFLLIDGLAAAISVPAFIFAGYLFADKITGLFRIVDAIKHFIIWPALVILVGAAALYLLRRRRLSAAVENL